MKLLGWQIAVIVVASVIVASGIGVGIYFAVKPKDEHDVCVGANEDGLCDKGYYAKYIEQ